MKNRQQLHIGTIGLMLGDVDAAQFQTSVQIHLFYRF